MMQCPQSNQLLWKYSKTLRIIKCLTVIQLHQRLWDEAWRKLPQTSYKGTNTRNQQISYHESIIIISKTPREYQSIRETDPLLIHREATLTPKHHKQKKPYHQTHSWQTPIGTNQSIPSINKEDKPTIHHENPPNQWNPVIGKKTQTIPYASPYHILMIDIKVSFCVFHVHDSLSFPSPDRKERRKERKKKERRVSEDFRFVVRWCLVGFGGSWFITEHRTIGRLVSSEEVFILGFGE